MSATSANADQSVPGLAVTLATRRREGFGLPGSFYTDPDIYQLELRRIFHRHWSIAGHVSQAPRPGDYFQIQVDTEQVIIARDRSGTLHALLNSCRHRGSEVCTEPQGHTTHFVCPYHAWSYALDGGLIGARLMPDSFDRSQHGLRRLALREEQGVILISFAPLIDEPPLPFNHVADGLADSIGRYGWGEAVVAHRQTYTIAANWKLAVENYVECYHCAPSHPEYSRTHALEQPLERIASLNAAMEQRTADLGISIGQCSGYDGNDPGELFRCFRYALKKGVRTGSQDGAAIAPLMGQFSDYDGGITSIHIGGFSFLVAYPDHGVIYRFWPKAVGECAMELIWLVAGNAVSGRDYDPARLTWLWQVTSDADKRIIEHNARGVASRFYEPGPLSPMERTEDRWLSWYLKQLG